MSSQARDSRAEERRLSIRTLLVASVSSAIAAIVTSRLWAAGTPIAAAMTPVLVTLVSELLHRPTTRIAGRFTVETNALPPGEPGNDDVHVPRSAERRRTLPWKLIAATAALAFVIGVVVLTLPRVIAGESLLEGSPPGYGSASKQKDRSAPAEQDTRQAPAPTGQDPATTSPESTTTTEEPEPETVPEVTSPELEIAPPPDTTEPAPGTTTQPTPQQGTPQP